MMLQRLFSIRGGEGRRGRGEGRKERRKERKKKKERKKEE